jgi:hypothetical protein
MRYVTDAKDENKEGGTVFNLLHKYLGISVLIVNVFLLCFIRFCNPSSSANQLMKLTDHIFGTFQVDDNYATP